MRTVAITVLSSVLCLFVGLCLGTAFSTQLKATAPALAIQSVAAKLPFGKSVGELDPESPFESYDYPTIKWRAHPLSDGPGAIVQLHTTYDAGKMKYRVIVFKAPGRQQCEVQMLDSGGFKLMGFNAGDFHAVAGAPDIMESRDAVDCPESMYNRMREYSIK